MTDIARCPHCGTDFTPTHMMAEIERLQADLELVSRRLVEREADIEQLREQLRVVLKHVEDVRAGEP